jgi:hypothetical protein
MDYRLLVDLEIVETIQGLPRRTKTDLLAHFQKIREYPSRHADYHEQDEIGRRIEISIHGRFAIHCGSILRIGTLRFSHYVPLTADALGSSPTFISVLTEMTVVTLF